MSPSRSAGQPVGGIGDSVSCNKFSGSGGGAVSDLGFRYDTNTVVVKFSC